MSTIAFGGTAASSSGGSVGGPLDVQYIVEQIIYAKQRPIRDLQTFQTFYEAKKTAFQTLNTKASAVESSLQALLGSGFSSKKAVSGDESVFTAKASAAADSGTNSIIVRQLARAQSDSSAGVASVSDLLLTDGTTFSITQDGETRDIQITGQTRSLSGLKNAINSSGLDVMATVVYDGSLYKLQVTSRSTGTEKGFTVTDTGVGTAMATKVSARDAWININTTEEADKIVRSSNTISDVLSGVTLNLKKADPETAIALNVSSDTEGFRGKLDTFVTAFNEAIDFLNSQFTYDTAKGRAGVLSGETAARKMQSDLLGMVTSRVLGIEASDPYKSLATIGMTINGDGQLEIDSTKLDAALTDHFDSVQRLFRDMGTSSSTELSYFGKTDATRPGSYAVSVTTAAEQASITGATPLATVAAGGETLTITLNGTAVDVLLAEGLDASQIVSTINTTLAAQGLQVTASKENSGGSDYLRLVTTAFGAGQSLSVVSGSSGDGSGIGTTLRTDVGVDVAGTIGGAAATGVGQVLTASGGDPKGLAVLVRGTALGDRGTVTFTEAIGERLRRQLYELTFPYSGLMAKSIGALDSQLEGITDKIAAINRQLETEQNVLLIQFSKANEALMRMESIKSTLSDIG